MAHGQMADFTSRMCRTLAVFATFALAGCEGWPPYSGIYVYYVGQHRADLERLAEKLDDSGFDRVKIRFGTSEEEREVYGETHSEDDYTRTLLDSDPEWTELFERAHVYGVSRWDSVYFYTTYVRDYHDSGFRRYRTSINYDPHSKSVIKPCISEYRSLPCGACSDDINAHWKTVYSWSPIDLATLSHWADERLATEEEEREILALPLEEQIERTKAAIKACRAHGDAKIGYDWSTTTPAD